MEYSLGRERPFLLLAPASPQTFSNGSILWERGRVAYFFFPPPLICPRRRALRTLCLCEAGHGYGLARPLCSHYSFSGSHFLLVPVSSHPGSEISVHIPKQRLGLVKRGSLVEESLSPRFLQVHQSDTFTVTEDRDFVVVSIPATLLLQDQVSGLVAPPCCL